MSEIPAVSVVIPLYNKGPYIARALNSVFAQTFQDFEVIVVDDGSTDDGAEIVRAFDEPRIRLIQQENRGVSAARNRGIAAARAELVAFLDADDEWLPEFLETILRLRRKFPDAGAYATSYYIQYYSHLQEANIQHLPSKPWEGIISRFFQVAAKSEPITSSSVCIPKTVFDRIGFFAVGKWWGEDTEMWGRIALYYHIAFCREPIAVYHYEATNRANEKTKVEINHPFMQTGSEYMKRNERKISPSDLSDLQEYMEVLRLKLAGRALKSKEPKLARKIIRECNTRNQRGTRNIVYLISFLPGFVYQAARAMKITIYTLQKPHIRIKNPLPKQNEL
ncbi:glycosyltransferase family 2 protein [Methanoculleus sp.]|uniref:glycosyltransferase family 2 protein n=1 Tax=Methanoculleus sp. TaxID=90427 RepID=UPI001BD303F7|nr:glycosyltransferase family 2 protein [Methanoculleus sp.]